jgi:hypothetical protein
MFRAALRNRKLCKLWYVLIAATMLCAQLNVFILGSLEGTTRSPARQYTLVQVGSSRPLNIPRIIHHTFHNRKVLTREQKAIMATWAEMNPNWKVVNHDDADCLRLVENNYPSYLQLFNSFPKNVERADFFRYLVLYHYGGVYVDIDVECVVPLDQWLGSDVRLVIGVENEFSDIGTAMIRSYPRRRQYQQWAIMSSKGHPLFDLVLRRIEQYFQSESAAKIGSVKLDLSNRATLERTGPALWTDVVSSYLDTTLRNWESKNNSLYPGSNTYSTPFADEVWILPRVSTAAFPNGADFVDPRNNRVMLMHHFLGGWKAKDLSSGLKTQPLDRLYLSKEVTQPSAHGFPVTALLFSNAATRKQDYAGLKSVTVFASPMNVPVGFNGLEEGATLSTWGTWQGSMAPGDPQGLSILHTKYMKSIEEVGLETMRFVEIGSATGLRALEAAKLGVRALSIASRSTDASRIEFSSKLCGVEKFVSVVDATSDFDDAVRLLGQFTRPEVSERKTAVHFEGRLGVELLGASVFMDTDAVDFFTGIIFFETSPELVSRLLSGMLQKKYKVFHAGNICRQLTPRKRRTMFEFLYAKILKALLLWRSYTGPSLSVRKHSLFREPWCEVGSSDEHALEFSNSYFSDASTSGQEEISDGEAFVFLSEKAKMFFDEKRKIFLGT